MLTIDSEFKTLIPALSAEEYEQLEINILRDGCRDPLVIWGDILIDGHNRYAICQQHGLSFQTIEMAFNSRDDVKIWIIRNQFGRRNLTPYVRGELALVMKGVIAVQAKANQGARTDIPQNSAKSFTPIETRATLAKVSGLSHDTISRIEKIAQVAPPETREALRRGDVSINQVYQDIKKQEKVAQSQVERQERIEQATTIAQQHTLDNYVLGNCIDVLTALPNDCVRLLLTDPPYGMAFQSNRRTASDPLPAIANDDNIQSAIDTFSMMLKSAYHAMMQDSHMLIFCHWRYERLFMDAIELAGFSVDASLVWVKENHTSGDLTCFAPKHERIIYARRGNVGITPRIPDVLIEARQYETGHPTEKPVNLLKRLIDVCTVENELVLDPFAGTGSTAVSSIDTNRKFYCVEMDPSWHSIAVQRIVNSYSKSSSHGKNPLSIK